MHVRVGGTWQQVEEAYVKSGGVWELFYQNLSAQLSGTVAGHIQSAFGGDCYAGIQLKSSGGEYYYPANGSLPGASQLIQSWLLAGSAADFWVRATLNSGTLDGFNSGTGTWLALSTSRQWAVLRPSSSAGEDTADIDLDIATDASGSNIIASANYLLSATVF